MKRYPEYKESEVQWLDEIPSHWSLSKLKHTAIVNPTKSSSGYDKDAADEVTFLPMENVSEDGRINTSIRKPVNELWSGFTYFEEGDTIVAKITPCFENGKGAYLRNLGTPVGFGSTEFHVLRPRDGVSDGRFLYYLIYSHTFRATGEAFMTGAAGQKRVPTDFVEEFALGLPPVDEQRQLAAYLDRKTGEIDTLIRKKQALIALLKEQRTVLINRAVTKGLDPNVPMKDSGLDWLGPIPEHWTLRPLSWILDLISYGFTNPMPVAEAGPLMLTANDIGDGKVYYGKARKTAQIDFDLKLTDKSRPREGDILVTKDGTLGRVAVHDGRPACINQSVALIRVADGLASVEFVQNVLRASSYQSKMIFDAGGTTIKHIYITRLAKMRLGLPDIDEQRAICDYVREVRKRYNELISHEKALIRNLADLRVSLISEVITGKIDVRHSEPTEALEEIEKAAA